MCYIMISKRIRDNSRDLAVEAKIKKVALEKLVANPDGFFIQNGDVPLRTMDIELAKQVIKDMPFDNAIMHFRYATVGKKDVTNVHGWEASGFQFLHNGGVSEYEPKRNSYGYRIADDVGLDWEHTDSKRLFDDLRLEILKRGISSKKIIKAIKYVINNCSFWGRAVLIDKVHDKAFLFGDWHTYLADDSYLIFSSADINMEQDFKLNRHGIDFEYSTKPLLESSFDGVAIISNFSKPNFHFKYREELEDISLDERIPEPQASREEYYGLSQARWTQPDTAVKEYSEGLTSAYDPDDGGEMDIWDVPEYQSMNPYDMDVITNEEGTHDVYGICCEYGTCYIYETPDYLAYQKSLYKEEVQQELDFLNGIKKEERAEEILATIDV